MRAESRSGSVIERMRVGGRRRGLVFVGLLAVGGLAASLDGLSIVEASYQKQAKHAAPTTGTKTMAMVGDEAFWLTRHGVGRALGTSGSAPVPPTLVNNPLRAPFQIGAELTIGSGLSKRLFVVVDIEPLEMGMLTGHNEALMRVKLKTRPVAGELVETLELISSAVLSGVPQPIKAL